MTLRSRSRASLGVAVGAVLLTGACEKHEFHPPSREAQVAEADTLYSPALFDTIQWTDARERLQAGNGVYAAECDKCHGYLGRGGTEYALERGLEVPSVVEPEWEYGSDVKAVRRRIFTGHPAGMPTWGVAGISPREIDAVAHYIVEGLRPEVLAQPPDTAR